MPTRIAISKEIEAFIVENGVKLINNFYRDLRENEALIPEKFRDKYKAIAEIARTKHNYDFTVEELVTLDSDTVPRIEIRRAESGEAVQMSIIGIPVDLKYDTSGLELESFGNLDLCRAGNVSIEISVKNVDKALPIQWLEKGQLNYPDINKEKSVAIGDRANHNDASLVHAAGAFVSVCENNSPSYIPEHVKLRIGHNENGSKKLLEQLLLKAQEFNQMNRLEPVIVNTLEDVVERIRLERDSCHGV